MNKSCAVVIFNFIDFDVHDHLERRTSSLRDVERLEKLFHLFNTDIEKIINPNLQEFKEKIDKLSKFDFTNYESILLIYMSHGDTENTISCKDGKFNFLEESKKIFRENSTLNKKPKFITVQACKGSFDADFYAYDDKKDLSDDSHITAILMSSFEGFVSRLGDDNGSYFIEVFTEMLRTSWNKKPFLQILKDVSKEFNVSRHESAGTIQIRPNVCDDISNFILN
ncbi:caspase-14-like [Episyrphus balteatus]|uniref:caspase-14-like n=1 Tax=Episyrphus balteatus TaxID=286459 RepID=UPI00248659AC|nr:caspase-14-like [Episyrphus balteatus]